MARLLLIRHGETKWNVDGRYQGQTDTTLSDIGITQAKLLANALKNEKVSRIYSSDLKRALATATVLAETCNSRVIPDNRLREMSFGIWEGKTRQEVRNEFPELFARRHKDVEGTRIPGGEVPGEVQNRVMSLLQEVVSTHQEETVAIVSHGGTLRLVFCALFKLSASQAFRFRMHNTGLSIVSYTDNDHTDSKWRVHLINSWAHLEN